MPKTHLSKRKRYTDVGAEFIPFLISKTYAICRGGIYSVPNKQNIRRYVGAEFIPFLINKTIRRYVGAEFIPFLISKNIRNM